MTEVNEPERKPGEDRFANVLRNHLSHRYDQVLDIEPMPTPRPRFTTMWKSFAPFFGQVLTPGLAAMLKKLAWTNTYHPTEYTKYKTAIAEELKKRMNQGRIPEGIAFTMLAATFYLPYPKSTAKKWLINFIPHFKKPDADNLMKGLMDGMGDAGVFANDSNIADLCIRKCYTTKEKGYMAFTLA